MDILDRSTSILFLLPFAALPFLLVNWARYMKEINESRKLGAPLNIPFYQFSGFPIKSVIAFVAPIILIFAISSVLAANTRKEVVHYLSKATGNAIVRVENQIVSDPKSIIEQLQKVRPYLAHHTHPGKVIHILIEDRGRTLAVNLARDSGWSNEYWVFYPDYRSTSSNEIGRITTNLFDSYK